MSACEDRIRGRANSEIVRRPFEAVARGDLGPIADLLDPGSAGTAAIRVLPTPAAVAIRVSRSSPGLSVRAASASWSRQSK